VPGRADWIARRAKNKIVGRALARGGFWRGLVWRPVERCVGAWQPSGLIPDLTPALVWRRLSVTGHRGTTGDPRMNGRHSRTAGAGPVHRRRGALADHRGWRDPETNRSAARTFGELHVSNQQGLDFHRLDTLKRPPLPPAVAGVSMLRPRSAGRLRRDSQAGCVGGRCSVPWVALGWFSPV